jgi:hypothetical protein
MNCRQVERRLPLYVSGEIGGRRGRRIGLHLEACPHCRAAFDAYAAKRCRLRAIRDDEDRTRELNGFYDELAARLIAERRSRSARDETRRDRRRIGVRRVGWGLATSLAVALVLVWAGGERFGAPGAAPGAGPELGGRIIAEPDGLDGVQPFSVVGTQSESRRPLRVVPATYEPTKLMILAGPRAVVPIVAPALPANPPLPRVQPYAGPSFLADHPERRVH